MHYIMLADDDEDDCLLFQEALNEISLPTQLITVRNGEQLMEELGDSDFPDVLFLDLNMPRKDGFQCLIEIKQNEKLSQVPVIIFSTSFQPDVVSKLYDNGAHYYIRKPSNFEHFKKVIHHAITLTQPTLKSKEIKQPSLDKFVLEPDKV